MEWGDDDDRWGHRRPSPSTPTTSPPRSRTSTDEMDFDRFYCDGSFLKLLHETLQTHVGKLKKGAVKLALNPHGIAYLFERLQTTLCPKHAQDGSGRIDGWTIRRTTCNDTIALFECPVLSPMAGDGASDLDQAPIGHLDVLKLSTLLHEAKVLKVSHDAASQRRPCPDLHLEIFSAMTSVELREAPAETLQSLACFPRQLEVLEYHGGQLPGLMELLLHKSWPCLQSLKVCDAHLHAWHADLDTFLPALAHIDCSGNALHTIEDLMASTSLLSARFSHNALRSFSLRSRYTALTALYLDHNHLASLEALPIDQLPALQILDLSFNALANVDAVACLARLRLDELCLRGNPLAAYPDYRRQVLFHVGPRVELDGAPWTTTEVESMRYSRQHAPVTRTDALGYPLLPARNGPRLRPRVAAIEDTFVLAPFLPKPVAKVAARPRVESGWSDNSVLSSVDDFVLVTPTHRARAGSYYVDEFLRDLAAEEDGDDDDDDDDDDDETASDDEMEMLRPVHQSSFYIVVSKAGIDVRLYLSLDEAESLDVPASQEGLPATIHLHTSKVLEEIDSGHVLARPLASLRCVAVTGASAPLVKLGFRGLPSVAYEVSAGDVASIVGPLQQLLCRKAVLGTVCHSCKAFAVLREHRKRVASVLHVRKCWVCRSPNVRECSRDQLSARLAAYGGRLEKAPPQEIHAGFVLTPEYDDARVLPDQDDDEIVLVATDAWIKDVKLTWRDDEDDDPMLEAWRRLCHHTPRLLPVDDDAHPLG
ncbi:hypothetical protein SPRG_06441 [Saprolegnia parasitica CBS 223.65]|uniref:Uncharacterized protein n=1 Tax=Saprolegnia parasitica (strain CBS 223.65) TaxID=695850 RepID=A0A067CHB9_SAPPC|nr:hypothetical protein SPRG_06441 [Saprolegnia parasitica CBS 223.65]KDO28585.1 hypothetical protein SPRG_06441 [Saprolegnia parasitica CBS 223.65]|eukprot:XP_012200648.1 hypothetical protein SPRG_06441 [Saprolegnia parasitica CBS 223.65]